MPRTVFTGANLLDGRHPARPGTSVVVAGERIAGVSPDGSVQKWPDDRVIALGGRTLMPGMATCHFHAGFDGQGLAIFPFGLDQPPGVLMLRAARNSRRALDCGFTMLVGAGSGDASDAQLVMAIDQGIVVDGDPSVDVSVLGDPARLHAILKGGSFVKDTLVP